MPFACGLGEALCDRNMKMQSAPWVSGPREILKHGLTLLKRDSDSNRRLAMIMIDNSVELMTKTYLRLPKRVSGLSISRKKYQEISRLLNRSAGRCSSLPRCMSM